MPCLNCSQANARKLLACLILLLASGQLHANDTDNLVRPPIFNVKDFGAVGDGENLDTNAIQQAIDACFDAGGGIVRVPAGDFHTGTIQFKSNITLSLDHGATLLGSQSLNDYPTDKLDTPRESEPRCLISEKELLGVAGNIFGDGSLGEHTSATPKVSNSSTSN